METPTAPAGSPPLATVPTASPAPSFADTLMAANRPAEAPQSAPAPTPSAPVETTPAAPAAPAAAPSSPDAAVAPIPAAAPAPLSTENPLDALMKGEMPKPATTHPGLAPTDPNSREFQTWKELRTAYDTQIKEAAELKRQLAETAARVPQDYEDLKRAVVEKETKLAQLDLTQRPEYQNVVAPMGQIMQTVNAVADKFKINKLHLDAAMHAPDFDTAVTELSTIFENAEVPVPAHISAMVMAKTEEFMQRNQAAQEYLSQAPQYMAQIRAQEQAEAQRQAEVRKLEFSHASEQTLEIIKNQIPEINNPETLNLLRASAQVDWNSLKPMTQAYMLMNGNITPKLTGVISELKTENSTLKSELASLRSQMERLAGAMPSTNGVTAQPVSPQDQSMSFTERLAQIGGFQVRP